MKVQLDPHSRSASTLRAQQAVYRQGKTPVSVNGRLHAADIAPSDARTTGRHLDEIHGRHGDEGLAQTVSGLSATRGWDFSALAIHYAAPSVQDRVAGGAIGANVLEAQEEDVASTVGRTIGGAIRRSAPTSELSESSRRGLGLEPAGDGSGAAIRIHNDEAAHRAAEMLHARAFTVGRSVYFGRGQFQPSTREGFRLLAHETAHAIQQGDASVPAFSDLGVRAPGSAAEVEAERFAQAAVGGEAAGPATLRHRPSKAALMRQISFTRSKDVVKTTNPGIVETPTTFQIGRGKPTGPHFSWTADVTISGHAGDPFANFNVGPHQVVRSLWYNFWWGTGANRSHQTTTVPAPIRDATATANTWYHDPFASGTFGASGDKRSTLLTDNPGLGPRPFANPIAGRASTRGWFNYGMSCVTYIAARDSAGAGAAAFQPLGHVFWNISIAGNFDTARAAGSLVQVTTPGTTNASRVFAGGSSAFPMMHGGVIANTPLNANRTTT